MVAPLLSFCKKQICWNSSKAKNEKNGVAGTPARLKMKKMGLLELQQGQKFKKQGCWNSSKAKNEKNRAAGTPASLKMKKMGRRKTPQGQI